MRYDAKTYWTERSEEYGEVYVAGGNDIDRYTDQVLSLSPHLLDGIHGGKVLDFGCGPERFRWAVEAAGAEYVGVDLIEKYGTQRLGNRLPTGFDYALAIFVLQHIVDESEYVHWTGELYRCLNGGGKLFVVDHDYDHPGAPHMNPRGIERLWSTLPWSSVERVGRYRSHEIAWLTK